MTTTYSTRARSSGPGGRSEERPDGRPGGPRRFGGRRKVCAFCADKQAVIDYKAVGRLRRYLSERARMESARKSGTCAKHQRQLREAIKRARHMAFLPYASEHRRVTGPVAPPPTEQRVEAPPDPAAPQAGVAEQPEPETTPETAAVEETATDAVPEPEPEAEAAEEETAETKAEAVPEPEAAEEEAEEEEPEA